MSLSQRHKKSNNSEIIMFRKQEAALINNYVQSSRLDDMRFAGIRAAYNFMNPDRPHKFIDAILFHW